MKIAIAVLASLPLMGIMGCKDVQDIRDYGTLEGLDEVCLLVEPPSLSYFGSTQDTTASAMFDSLRLWQETTIKKSLERHGIKVTLSNTCTEYPKRFLEFYTNVITVLGGTSNQHYLLQMRFNLTEVAHIKRADDDLDMLAVTWEREYPVTLFDETRIAPFLGLATENMLIEFEHDLIDMNQDRLGGFEKRPFKQSAE